MHVHLNLTHIWFWTFKRLLYLLPLICKVPNYEITYLLHTLMPLIKTGRSLNLICNIYFLKSSVLLALWEKQSKEHFERVWSPFTQNLYYALIIKIYYTSASSLYVNCSKNEFVKQWIWRTLESTTETWILLNLLKLLACQKTSVKHKKSWNTAVYVTHSARTSTFYYNNCCCLYLLNIEKQIYISISYSK